MQKESKRFDQGARATALREKKSKPKSLLFDPPSSSFPFIVPLSFPLSPSLFHLVLPSCRSLAGETPRSLTRTKKNPKKTTHTKPSKKQNTSLPPKNKWSAEEEQALRDGVDRFGAGKWRVIQKDAVFGAILSTRSNVDLKVNGERERERERKQNSKREREREKKQQEREGDVFFCFRLCSKYFSFSISLFCSRAF